MEILDFYDNYRQIPEDRINQALSKLPQRTWDNLAHTWVPS
jgi:hypothetical protein